MAAARPRRRARAAAPRGRSPVCRSLPRASHMMERLFHRILRTRRGKVKPHPEACRQAVQMRRIRPLDRPRLDPTPPFVYSYCTVGASQDPRLAVGLIGLGHMGTAFGERLLAAGYPLVVYNRTSEKAEPLAELGADIAESLEALAGGVDVVLTSLSDDDALASVAATVAGSARPGTVLVDLSTVSPGVSASVAAVAADAGLSYL